MGLADPQGMAHTPFMAVKTPGRFNAGDPFNRLSVMIQAQVAPCAVLTQQIAFSNGALMAFSSRLNSGLALAEA